MEDKYYDIIDRYLREELSKDEKIAFDEAMQGDESLRQNFAIHKALFDGIQEQRREELKQYLRDNTKIKFMGNIWGRKWALASAAIIAFFVILYFVLQNFQPSQITTPPVVDNETITDDKIQEEAEATDDIVPENVEKRLADKQEKKTLTKDIIPPEAMDEVTRDEMEVPIESGVEEEKATTSKSIRPEVDYKTKTEIKIGEGFLLVSVLQSTLEVESLSNAKTKKDKAENAEIIGTEEIQVEYWVSPVDFKGYKLQNNLLVLYGLNQNSGIKMYRIGNQLILREGFNTYNLHADGRYREYERVVNPEILQLIPE